MSARLLRFAAVLAALFYGCNLSDAPGGGTGVDGLTGVVVDESGAPVAGARVWVHPASAASAAPGALDKTGRGATSLVARAESTFTGADGRYRFKKLPHGLYNLQAASRVRDTARALFVPGIVFEKSLDLQADTLKPAGSLGLRVRDSSGLAAAGAACAIPGSAWRTIADSSGVCLFTDVAPGRFRVTAVLGNLYAVTGIFEVAPGALTWAGELTLGVAPDEVPGNWIRVSAQGYDFWIPPTLALESEGGPGTAWRATYDGGGLRLMIRSSSLTELDPYGGLPEYPDSVEVEPGVRAKFTWWRLSDPVGSMNYATRLVLGAWEFQVIGATENDLEDARRILRSVRKWQGPGPAPLAKPAPPELVGPDSGDSVTVDSVLSWRNTMPTTVTSYRVEVFNDTAASPVHAETVVPNVVSKALDANFSGVLKPLSPGLYFWRVVAVGPGGSTPSTWRRVAVHAWKHFTLNGSLFQAPVGWVQTDSMRFDSVGYDHSQLGTESASIRWITASVDPKPDLSLKENRVVREIPWAYQEGGGYISRAMLTEYTEPQSSSTTWAGRVDFWIQHEGYPWEEDNGSWVELRASTRAEWEKILEILASNRLAPTTYTSAPPARKLLAPENGMVGASLTPTLSWVRHATMDWARYFRVEVFEDGLQAARVANDSVDWNASSVGDTHVWTLKPLKPGTTYHWRVMAAGQNIFKDPRQSWSPSELRTFTTGNP